MILTIVIFIFVLGLLVFVHELGHFLAAKKAGIKVEEFAFGFPPRIWSRKKGETRYSINAVPLGGYVKLFGEDGKNTDDERSFYAKGLWPRFWVIVTGVLMNFFLAWILFSIGFSFGLPITSVSPDKISGPKTITSEVVVSEALPDTPAESAGIEKGDIIIGANGQNFVDHTDLSNFTKKNYGKIANFKIKRYSITRDVQVKLDGKKDAPLGVSILESQKIKVPFWKAPIIAAQEIGNIIYLIIMALVGLIISVSTTGKATDVGVGPVGIWFIFQTAVKLGIPYIIQLTALISVNLGLINILPFPALDGGRLIFWVIEAIRKKRVTPKIESIVHAIGFAILIILILLISFKDIIRGGN